MASLSESVSSLATRVGAECKTLHSKIGALADLTTTEKGNLVAALNELQAALENASNIDDANASTSTTYSSSKIASEILAASNALKADLLGGAGEAYDTLKELADLIQTNQSAIDALEALAAGHVKYDAAQTLTDEQKEQARANIGASAASDVTSLTNRVTAVEGVAAGNTSAINTLTGNVGSTTTNFVTAFETALGA
ncbi:hypothetical protein [Desulfovibrio sp. SGI.169]|uniref:hypothetical protein n=1 Tax=Desulfovibrio sp. SGI.169 TaxID=3420561 RepID=UPI003D07BC05